MNLYLTSPPRPPYAQPKLSGFTLIELMLTLTVLAIITAIALPTYNGFVLKVRRAEAKSALYILMQHQERFYTQTNTYSEISNTNENTVFKKWSGDSESASYYQLSAQACALKTLNECVQITATPYRFNDPVCGSLILDSAHNKTYSNGTKPNILCW